VKSFSKKKRETVSPGWRRRLAGGVALAIAMLMIASLAPAINQAYAVENPQNGGWGAEYGVDYPGPLDGVVKDESECEEWATAAEDAWDDVVVTGAGCMLLTVGVSAPGAIVCAAGLAKETTEAIYTSLQEEYWCNGGTSEEGTDFTYEELEYYEAMGDEHCYDEAIDTRDSDEDGIPNNEDTDDDGDGIPDDEDPDDDNDGVPDEEDADPKDSEVQTKEQLEKKKEEAKKKKEEEENKKPASIFDPDGGVVVELHRDACKYMEDQELSPLETARAILDAIPAEWGPNYDFLLRQLEQMLIKNDSRQITKILVVVEDGGFTGYTDPHQDPLGFRSNSGEEESGGRVGNHESESWRDAQEKKIQEAAERERVLKTIPTTVDPLQEAREYILVIGIAYQQ